jgi:hypothetical protein
MRLTESRRNALRAWERIENTENLVQDTVKVSLVQAVKA